MCDLLGKNLLLLIWFTKDFEGESFASSLGTFLCMGLVEEEYFASILGIFWGRIFYFLTRDLLLCTWVHRGGIFCLFHRYDA